MRELFSRVRIRSNMSRILTNQRGFAMIYGLIVLLLATLAGTAILVMTRQGRTGAGDYGKMRVASQAALAAIKACEGQFSDQPQTAFEILKKHTESSSYCWMLGTANDASTEQKIAFWGGGDSPEYSARIVSYDSENQYIQIEGIGYAPGGGRKTVLASYQLSGLGLENWPTGSHALYLGGRLQNLNGKISILGDVYMSMAGGSPQHFNDGGLIDGNLKTASSTNTMDITSGGPLTVNGNALMQCKMEPQGLFFIKGDAAFTGSFTSNYTNDIRINGNGYFTQTSSFGQNYPCVDGNSGGGKTLYYNNWLGSSWYKDFDNTASIAGFTTDYIAGQLGMTAGNESPFTLDIPSWDAGVVKYLSSGTYDGEDVDSWWNAKKNAGTLFQDKWLVLQLNSSITMNGGTFTKKVIWITGNHSITVNTKWYHCTDESNTLLIVNGSGFLSNMGVPSYKNFRGVIYANTSSTNMNYEFGYKTKIYGMIHHTNGAAFNLNKGSSDSLRIWFETDLGQTAVQEIVNTGILVPPGYSGAAPPGVVLLDVKIRPTMLGLQL